MTRPRFAAAVSFRNFSTSRRDSSRVMLAFARRKYAEIEYGYPIVVTPGVASARSNPFSFTTIPIISGSSALGGREAFSFVIIFSLSAICFTCFGETKLTASMCLNPACTNSFKYSALYSVGIMSGNPCHASRGHSISFTFSMSGLQDSCFEFADFGIERDGFERPNQRVSCVRRIDDGVDPEAGGGVARVGLVFVGGADGIVQFFFLLLVDFFAFALELLQFDFDERAGGGVAAHHREARRRPGKHEARVVGFAAHGVISGAETSAANHGDFRDDTVRHGIYHFCARADDAAPFGVLADHKAVHVVEKNQRDAILVAVQNKARGFFRGLGVNHAAKFHALDR